jgi:hypothetical protein
MMDIVERLRDEPEITPAQYWEGKANRLREALLHIAWGGIQSVDDAEKYARKILEESD